MTPDFLRHEHSHLVATLVRRVGVQHLGAVEDAAQAALLAAVERWGDDRPQNPTAWLYRVAYNQLIGSLRTDSRRRRILEGSPAPESEPPPAVFLPGELRDDLLRMLFVACDDAIPPESQRIFALKTLCGFGVREIAARCFLSEAAVYKRLARARERLRSAPPRLEELDGEDVLARLPAVHGILYRLFTEGHLSSHAEVAIRRELCAEALRLTLVLASHPLGDTPQTQALVALMYLHGARLTARQDGSGGLVLLEDQDRDEWDREAIGTGLTWLARSARGDVFSRYHAEARIAAEHCLAPSFSETRWDVVARTYELLERIAPSPVHTLNRALAVAEWRGPAAGLALLEGLEPPSWLAGSHQWSAVLADLHRRCGHAVKAGRYRRVALESAPSPAVRELLERRLMP